MTVNDSLQYKVFDRQQIVYEGEFPGPVLLGRQNDLRANESEEVFRPRRLDANRWRLVIARYDENNVSREHALVEPLPGNRVRISNYSTKLMIPIQLPFEVLLPRWDRREQERPPSQEVELPCIFHLGPKTVRVQPDPGINDGPLQSLSEVTRPPGPFQGVNADRIKRLREPAVQLQDEALDPETLVRWLQSTIGVLQDAANASDFFLKAAQAMVDNIGLDTGWVLTWEEPNQEWIERACHYGGQVGDESDRRPSNKFLNRVRELKKTSWTAPDQNLTDSNRSLLPVKAAVAAPILDRSGQVIGALYGDRRQGARGEAQFSKVEALLVELLAGGVATGLARLEQERNYANAVNQIELILGPQLADWVRENPDMALGREAEITVLFADIRNFSKISRFLGHKATFDWINDVMQQLSECVTRHQGVIVDYIGDALMAMWGAPQPDPDHANRACLAAIDMLATVPTINKSWMQLPERMGLGIGINTGMASIGNTGSHHRIKYGPLGTTVNLASRVEGATKYLKSYLMVTEMTHRLLDPKILSRRLCSVRVVNIDDPVNLYEIVDPERFVALDPERYQGDWADLQARYDRALTAFEDEQFNVAAQTLGNLLTDFPKDGPSLVLMKRVVNGLIEGPDEAHPVWELPGK
ncbi:adenylate/guanylate cyclase domain-containing protein [Tautonia sociabilis]|uniref:Adenylate/guanylate cyclase domain-containing protein n=1 Tax=Tautonia sociabilis TaxID=2080755 RepID=A0A432MLR4_9BACT|nr:adenylate/guanylate cyclase domain-containing protein [Tautonia sociabilis]RUL88364.1 adenylate/guanylate cyclase domain-containing protein [Tautonia sociabilis]